MPEEPADPQSVLAGLDPEQTAAATALHGPVCVLAGAGTGKTRAITHRIAYGVLTGTYDPRRVLAVTFTVKAAGQMRSRLRALGVETVQARTFHSAALRQARWFWPRTVGHDLPPIIDSKLGLLREAMARVRVSADLRDVAAEIEWAKVSNVTTDGYPAAASAARRSVAGTDEATMARLYSAYESVKSDRHVIDLEDVLLAAVGLMMGYPAVAAEIRTQYRHLVVDEYQDVSALQQRLLDLWLGDSNEICVVGDPAQTIYSFAGARPEYLLGFAARHPGAEVVRLVRDYRSTPQVVQVANQVSALARDGAGAAGVRLRAMRPDGPPVSFEEHADEVAEAQSVTRRVRELLALGVSAREMAVLYRVNAQSEPYEQALGDAGVAYTVRGGERFFRRPEVRQAVTLLRGAARAGEASGDLAGDVRAVLSTTGFTSKPPSATGAARERWESLSAIVALAEELAAANAAADLTALVADLDERAAAQDAPQGDGVTLSTLHAAKGLEWDAVFLVGAQEGSLPLSYAETAAEIEEERRLLYVGVTRARSWLYVSWSRSRVPGGRGSRRPTRFLDGIRPDQAAAPVQTAGRRTARTVARCRVCGRGLTTAAERKLSRCASCPGTPDEALFERLRSWRSEQALEQKVPAYVVFTDATLTAIAEARPVTTSALARIPGVGKVKLDRYGVAVMQLCAPRADA